MIAHTTKEIIVNFLQRDAGMSESDARKELEVLFINGKPVTRDYYLTVRRVGLVGIGSRKKRADIYESFLNAKNHADFSA
jgi:hypothetical protein